MARVEVESVPPVKPRSPLLRRAWSFSRALTKGALAVLGLATALVAIPALWSDALNQIFPYDRQYTVLNELSAGIHVGVFDARLGPPSVLTAQELETPSRGSTKHTVRTYLKTDYVVRTLADENGLVVMYSVLSCNRRFQPTFATDETTSVQLHSKPMDTAQINRGTTLAIPSMTTPTTPTPEERAEAAVLFVGGSGTFSMYLDYRMSSSFATLDRGSSYGFNGVCGDLDVRTSTGAHLRDFPLLSADEQFSEEQGAVTEAEALAAIVRLRSTVAPNFFVETAANFTLPNDSASMFSLISPSSFEFPPRYNLSVGEE